MHNLHITVGWLDKTKYTCTNESAFHIKSMACAHSKINTSGNLASVYATQQEMLDTLFSL